MLNSQISQQAKGCKTYELYPTYPHWTVTCGGAPRVIHATSNRVLANKTAAAKQPHTKILPRGYMWRRFSPRTYT